MSLQFSPISKDNSNNGLTVHDLVSAILIAKEGNRDPDYWNLRISLLLSELGYGQTQLLNQLKTLRRATRNWNLPYDGALEVPDSPDFHAQKWIYDELAPDIAEIRNRITEIHSLMFLHFFELWRKHSGLQEKSTTEVRLIELGLPGTEPLYDSLDNY